MEILFPVRFFFLSSFLQLSLSLKCCRCQLELFLFFELLDTLLSVATSSWIN